MPAARLRIKGRLSPQTPLGGACRTGAAGAFVRFNLVAQAANDTQTQAGSDDHPQPRRGWTATVANYVTYLLRLLYHYDHHKPSAL